MTQNLCVFILFSLHTVHFEETFLQALTLSECQALRLCKQKQKPHLIPNKCITTFQRRGLGHILKTSHDLSTAEIIAEARQAEDVSLF